MTTAEDAFGAVVGLVVGGIIFITFGSALAGTTLETAQFINLELWGVLYILAAVLLAALLVAGVVSSFLESL